MVTAKRPGGGTRTGIFLAVVAVVDLVAADHLVGPLPRWCLEDDLASPGPPVCVRHDAYAAVGKHDGRRIPVAWSLQRPRKVCPPVHGHRRRYPRPVRRVRAVHGKVDWARCPARRWEVGTRRQFPRKRSLVGSVRDVVAARAVLLHRLAFARAEREDHELAVRRVDSPAMVMCFGLARRTANHIEKASLFYSGLCDHGGMAMACRTYGPVGVSLTAVTTWLLVVQAPRVHRCAISAANLSLVTRGLARPQQNKNRESLTSRTSRRPAAPIRPSWW